MKELVAERRAQLCQREILEAGLQRWVDEAPDEQEQRQIVSLAYSATGSDKEAYDSFVKAIKKSGYGVDDVVPRLSQYNEMTAAEVRNAGISRPH